MFEQTETCVLLAEQFVGLLALKPVGESVTDYLVGFRKELDEIGELGRQGGTYPIAIAFRNARVCRMEKLLPGGKEQLLAL